MLVQMAKAFAIAAHEGIGQKRRYTNVPYWHHPSKVAKLVEEYGGSEAQIAAAWLHDVVEDTKVTLDVIEDVFGSEVADLVFWVTKTTNKQTGARSYRKAISFQFLGMAPVEAQFIKVCDFLNNLEDAHDIPEQNFFCRYVSEINILMRVCSRTGRAYDDLCNLVEWRLSDIRSYKDYKHIPNEMIEEVQQASIDLEHPDRTRELSLHERSIVYYNRTGRALESPTLELDADNPLTLVEYQRQEQAYQHVQYTQAGVPVKVWKGTPVIRG